MITTTISTTVEACNYTMVYNPFVGGCKVIVEIIKIMENKLDFGNGDSEEEEPQKDVIMG